MKRSRSDLEEKATMAGMVGIGIVEGHWVIETLHEEHVWEFIVEPDMIAKLLVVVTAYPVWDD